MQNRRTIWIILIALYNAVYGLGLVLAGGWFFFMFISVFFTSAQVNLFELAVKTFLAIGGCLLLPIGCLHLVSAYGLWSLRYWGLKFTILLNIIGVLLNIIAIFQQMLAIFRGHTTFQSTNLIGIGSSIASILVIYYLSRPSIRTRFVKRSKLSPTNGL